MSDLSHLCNITLALSNITLFVLLFAYASNRKTSIFHVPNWVNILDYLYLDQRINISIYSKYLKSKENLFDLKISQFWLPVLNLF